jgi:hypothetical protein
VLQTSSYATTTCCKKVFEPCERPAAATLTTRVLATCPPPSPRDHPAIRSRKHPGCDPLARPRATRSRDHTGCDSLSRPPTTLRRIAMTPENACTHSSDLAHLPIDDNPMKYPSNWPKHVCGPRKVIAVASSSSAWHLEWVASQGRSVTKAYTVVINMSCVESHMLMLGADEVRWPRPQAHNSYQLRNPVRAQVFRYRNEPGSSAAFPATMVHASVVTLRFPILMFWVMCEVRGTPQHIS